MEFSYLFDLTPQLLHDSALSILAVLTLFFVASHFLFNPVRDMLKKRQDKIKEELEEAKGSLEKAQALQAEYEEKLKGIEAEADTILSEARKRALANENKILAEAREEALRIKERAEAEAELEKKRVADEVKKEIVTVASLMAGKVVAAGMNPEIQSGLVDETLKEMGENTWLS